MIFFLTKIGINFSKNIYILKKKKKTLQFPSKNNETLSVNAACKALEKYHIYSVLDSFDHSDVKNSSKFPSLDAGGLLRLPSSTLLKDFKAWKLEETRNR